MPRIPTHRAPTPPGEVLLHEFIEPNGLTQAEVARATGISFQRLNGVVNGHRKITPSTALRLSRYFGTTADLWMNLQIAVDTYETLQAERPQIEAIQPLLDA
ncbi:MAG: HigA family addiction module antitoxin [Rubricoccaceae bacterium]|nr:HigA family addiction module antitoxin [Rubricoccaceae bacterium]